MPSAEDVLLPGREVKLSDGTHVQVKPWSLRVGKRILEPLNQFLVVSGEHPTAKIPELIHAAWDEVMQIVKVTVDWDDEELNRHPLESVIELATHILEVCLVREGDGGLMGKMMRFGEVGGNALLTAAVGPERAAEIMADIALAEQKENEKPQKPRERATRGRRKTHSSK